MKKYYLKALPPFLALLVLSGCNGSLPTPQQTYKVDEKLPKVQLTSAGVAVEMNEIAFEWKPIQDGSVEGVKIYRKTGDSNTTNLLATIQNRYATHYVDLDVKPNTKYAYIFRSYKGDVVSQKNQLRTIYSKPVLPSVSWIHAINGLPRMAKILWRPHRDKNVESYIIERKTVDDENWKKIATLKGRLQAEFIDVDLKDKYTYRYRVRVKTFDGILSTPSEIVKVVTKPLPAEITGLQATTDLPKKIFLTWNSSHNKDFERYYLYRSSEKNRGYELIAKLYNNRFSDNVEKDGAKYFYKVSQKDIDGLESKKDKYIVMGSSLPKPSAPTISDAKLVGNAIVIDWFRVDPRSVRYIVRKEAKTGWFESKVTQKTLTSKHYTDTDIMPNTTYIYSVYAVDGNNIVSKPSQSVTIEVKELQLTPKGAVGNQKKNIAKKADKTKEQTQEKVQPIMVEVE